MYALATLETQINQVVERPAAAKRQGFPCQNSNFTKENCLIFFMFEYIMGGVLRFVVQALQGHAV